MRAALALLLLAACAEVPALDARLTDADRNAPFPALVPLGPILAAADSTATTAPASLDARLNRLAARAALLRRPVLTAADRARLGL